MGVGYDGQAAALCLSVSLSLRLCLSVSLSLGLSVACGHARATTATPAPTRQSSAPPRKPTAPARHEVAGVGGHAWRPGPLGSPLRRTRRSGSPAGALCSAVGPRTLSCGRMHACGTCVRVQGNARKPGHARVRRAHRSRHGCRPSAARRRALSPTRSSMPKTRGYSACFCSMSLSKLCCIESCCQRTCSRLEWSIPARSFCTGRPAAPI